LARILSRTLGADSSTNSYGIHQNFPVQLSLARSFSLALLKRILLDFSFRGQDKFKLISQKSKTTNSTSRYTDLRLTTIFRPVIFF